MTDSGQLHIMQAYMQVGIGRYPLSKYEQLLSASSPQKYQYHSRFKRKLRTAQMNWPKHRLKSVTHNE